MDNELVTYQSFEIAHNGRISVGLFKERVVVGVATLGCTADIHLTTEEAEKLATVLVEMLGKHDA